MKIETTTPARLTNREVNTLSELTCRTGTMRRELAGCRELKLGTVFIARRNGKVVGWLLLQHEDVSVYVRPSHRRMGVGTSLLAEARKHSPVLRCWSNHENEAFFASIHALNVSHWSERTSPVAV